MICSRYFKHLFDFWASLLALAVLSPLLFVLALLVRVKLGTPVLFCQERPGLGGEPFTLIKFRTMTDKRDAQGNLLPDAERLTKFGKFLRASSLDELPELWNVLKGEMSLVGPRPLLMQYLPLYTPEQARRHEVRPGITGMWQVSGRSDIAYDERVRLDMFYVRNWTIWLDISLLMRTIPAVIAGRGAY